MNKQQPLDRIEKLKTGIGGLDAIADGGLPKGRTTLVSAMAGSSKTVFSVQFLAEGIEQFAEPGVFVTPEESPAGIRRNMLGFDWEIDRWEADGKWLFVDGSPQLGEETVIAGRYDLGALLARVEYAVRKVNAKRVVIDSPAAIFSQFIDTSVVRSELFRFATAPKSLGVTAVMTAERTAEYGDCAMASRNLLRTT